MYQIAVCDDDKLFLQNIQFEIKRICCEHKILYKSYLFLNGNALLKKYEQQERFDLVILDISMPGKNEKEIAECLRKYDNLFDLMFVSSMEHEVFNTFSYGIASFIPKHRLNESFELEFVRILKLHEEKAQNTFLFKNRDSGAYVRYQFSQISYIDSVNRSVNLYLADKSHINVFVRSFEKLKKELAKYRFIEIHRTCIVNVAFIYRVDDFNVELETGELLLFSRRRKPEILDAIAEYVSEVVI